jgi:3-oxoacyl-[acyl-carrier-protein] synthase II
VDAVIAGGVESTITPLGVAGFTSMKAMSTSHNADPAGASRPFDRDRDGFVMGEGAGMLVLESLACAKARGAEIFAEVVGFGSSCDAYHMTAPLKDGQTLAMRKALQDAGVDPGEVDHINAHATSTPLNDSGETAALKDVFGKHAYDLAICANKSQIGHLLGAAGGVESVFSCMALHTRIVPGTINYATPDPDCDLNYMVDGPKKLDPRYVLCSNFGFGGANASILFKKYEA